MFDHTPLFSHGSAHQHVSSSDSFEHFLFNVLKMIGGQGVTVGPILLGAGGVAHVLTPSSTVRRVVNMTALTVADANAAR